MSPKKSSAVHRSCVESVLMLDVWSRVAEYNSSKEVKASKTVADHTERDRLFSSLETLNKIGSLYSGFSGAFYTSAKFLETVRF